MNFWAQHRFAAEHAFIANVAAASIVPSNRMVAIGATPTFGKYTNRIASPSVSSTCLLRRTVFR
jgi:hypothetical protein